MTKRTYVRLLGICLALLSSLYAQDATPSVASAQPAPPASQLIIYHAGSLTAAFKSIEAAFLAEHPGVSIVDKFGGSVNLARQVTVGGEPADIYASADYENIDTLLKPKWASYNIRFGQGSSRRIRAERCRRVRQFEDRYSGASNTGRHRPRS